VHVDNRTQPLATTGGGKHSPTDHAIKAHPKQNAPKTLAESQFARRKEDAGHGVQVASRRLQMYGTIQVGMLRQAGMQRRLEFVIVRTATMERPSKALHFRTCRERDSRRTWSRVWL